MAAWEECDDVDQSWAQTNLVEISRDEALLVMVAWQGAPDDLDAGDSLVSAQDTLPDSMTEDTSLGDYSLDNASLPRVEAASVVDPLYDVATSADASSYLDVPPPPAPDFDLAPTEIVLEPVGAHAPPAPALTAEFDVWTEPAPVIELPRREALSALRDLASELGSLGQAGLSWG